LLIAIIILAPVDTKSHRLTQKKKRRLKCLTAIYSIILLSLYLIFF
jgi:accessory gene regulator protein AgrB